MGGGSRVGGRVHGKKKDIRPFDGVIQGYSAGGE